MSNLHAIQRIYEAFGQGDVPTILAHLAPDVDWEYGGGSTRVPWLQQRRGREGAGEFFASLAGMRIERFQPKHILDGGDLVVVLVDIEFQVVATGSRVVEEDEVHIWAFNDQGQVNRFRHRVDTALQQAAFGG